MKYLKNLDNYNNFKNIKKVIKIYKNLNYLSFGVLHNITFITDKGRNISLNKNLGNNKYRTNLINTNITCLFRQFNMYSTSYKLFTKNRNPYYILFQSNNIDFLYKYKTNNISPFIVNKQNGKDKIKILKIENKKYKKIFNFGKKIVNEKIWLFLYLILNCNNNFNFNIFISYYDGTMKNNEYQTILRNLKNEWNHVKWIISFKFDTILTNDHLTILLDNIKEYTKDDKLILLLKLLLKKKNIGINYFNSISRFNIPQDDILSTLLINIFFYKLDKKINEIKVNFLERYNNSVYLNCSNSLNSKEHTNNVKYVNIKSNIKYIRYLDTFIIGVIGNKLQTNEIKNEIDIYLKSKLSLKNVYSYMTNIHNDNLKFLNFIISSGIDLNNQYRIILLSPRSLIIKALINTGILNNKRRPIPMNKLIKYGINTIFLIYININNFILNSFTFCQDFSSMSRFISYCIYCSLKYTIQIKINKNIHNFNLLIKLNLLDSNTLKNLYYLNIINKKHLKRKLVLPYLSQWSKHRNNLVNINWESKINLDFLILKNNSYSLNMFTKEFLLNCKIIIINK